MNLDFVRDKDDDELVDQGEAAQVLLQSPAYLKAVTDLTEACAQIFFTSSPESGEQRDDAYRLMRAMKDISDTLMQRVEIKNRIIQQREQENLAAAEEDDDWSLFNESDSDYDDYQ